MIRYLIYGLMDPRTLLIRYIGKSSNGMKRPRSHAQNVLNGCELRTHTQKWIWSLVFDGSEPEICILQESSKEALNEDEVWWIRLGKLSGWDLTNHTAGGDGSVGWHHSEASKRKIAQNLRGKSLSPERRRKISEAMRGRQFTDDHRQKLRKAKLGKPNVGLQRYWDKQKTMKKL